MDKSMLKVVRYSGDYSSTQLFGKYPSHEAALSALTSARQVALANGNRKVADSFHLSEF